MKFRIVSTLSVIALAATTTLARPVTSLDEVLKSGSTVTIDFNELKGKDKLALGSPEVGQPYSKLGLVLPSQIIDTNANLVPSKSVAIKATGISTVDNSDYQSIAFTRAQKIVAFNVRSPKATSIIVTALDKSGQVLGQQILDGSEETKFVGFAFERSEITVIRVVANHNSIGDALDAPTSITNITFSLKEINAPESARDGQDFEEFGLAGPVGSSVGSAGFEGAVASAGGNAGSSSSGGGGGTGGTNNTGRNPGNRNPNLPPAVIPEPTALAGLVGMSALLLRRRSRRA